MKEEGLNLTIHDKDEAGPVARIIVIGVGGGGNNRHYSVVRLLSCYRSARS